MLEATGGAAPGADTRPPLALAAMLAIAVLNVVPGGATAGGAPARGPDAGEPEAAGIWPAATAPRLNDPAGQRHWQLHASMPV
jgi:hypothetical protein